MVWRGGDEDVVEWRAGRSPEKGEGVHLGDVRFVAQTCGGEILVQRADGSRGGVDEDGRRRAATEGLDADAAGSGEEIEKPRAFDIGSDDVEERLLGPVPDRPRPPARAPPQPAALGATTD